MTSVVAESFGEGNNEEVITAESRKDEFLNETIGSMNIPEGMFVAYEGTDDQRFIRVGEGGKCKFIVPVATWSLWQEESRTVFELERVLAKCK